MFDPREERDFKTLIGLSKKLGVPVPEMFLGLEVTKDGRVLTHIKQRSHSWTRNAYNMLFYALAAKNMMDAGLFEAGKLSIKDTGGLVRTGNAAATFGWAYEINENPDEEFVDKQGGYRPAAGEDGWGILVGSGTNAESFEDHVLQTLIPNGGAGNELAYVAGEAHDVSYAALVLTDELVRYFNNNSGGNVSVNEVALVGHLYIRNAPYNTVFSRDKLASTVTVPDTGQLKVTYTIQLTYPS